MAIRVPGRVLAMMRIATSRGAKVVWAGLPISADYRLRSIQTSERPHRVRREHLQ